MAGRADGGGCWDPGGPPARVPPALLPPLLAAPLVWYFCEASWSALVAASLLCREKMHERKGLRQLVGSLPRQSLAAAERWRGASDFASVARRRLWRRLCLGAMSFGGEGAESYRELAARPGAQDADIRKDVDRTFPGAGAAATEA
ncbi:unnamed protein product, partial [Prorocentrum cordatum]